MFNQFSTRRFTAQEVEEILSDTNRYHAAKALGHEPTLDELIRHYTANKPPDVLHFNVESFEGNQSEKI